MADLHIYDPKDTPPLDPGTERKEEIIENINFDLELLREISAGSKAASYFLGSDQKLSEADRENFAALLCHHYSLAEQIQNMNRALIKFLSEEWHLEIER